MQNLDSYHIQAQQWPLAHHAKIHSDLKHNRTAIGHKVFKCARAHELYIPQPQRCKKLSNRLQSEPLRRK